MPAVRWIGSLALGFLLLGIPAHAAGQGAGVAPDGKKGRLHVVQDEDTLWDITAHYLGTPWIWPSVWIENDVENPHLIYPGDLIWITDAEMRKVTREEADALLRAGRSPSSPASAAPAAPGEPRDPFAALDVDENPTERLVRLAGVDHAPFVTGEEMEASAAVLGSHDEHYWLSQEDEVIVGLGEGQVHVGDRFHVYRLRRRVLHPETRKVVGFFVEILGRVEIREVHPESSFAMITNAYSEIEPGDLLKPYETVPSEFVPIPSATEVQGTIVAQQPHRSYSGIGDLVVLDQGTDEGVLTGHEFQVFRSGKLVHDPLNSARVLAPDDIIGSLFVVRSTPHTALALIMAARTEIEPGDHYRTPPE